MKKLLWFFYLLFTLSQVALEKEPPQVFLTELHQYANDDCPVHAHRLLPGYCPSKQ